MSEAPHLLLIDDNQSYLESLAEYLRAKGLPVITSDDPEKGIELLDQHAAWLVICDFNMPQMDGLKLIRMLRKHRSELAVLMLTSEDDPELEKRAVDAGALDFIAKNSSPRLLVKRVKELLQTRDQVVLSSIRLEPWQKLLPGPEPIKALPAASCDRPET